MSEIKLDIGRHLSVVWLLLIFTTFVSGQSCSVIESTKEKLSVLLEYPDSKMPYDLEEIYFTIGLPSPELPRISIDMLEYTRFQPSTIHSYDFTPSTIIVNWESQERFRNLNVGILKVLPLFLESSGNLALISRIQFTISFVGAVDNFVDVGKWEASLYRNRVINWNVAKHWLESLPPRKAKKSFLRREYQPLIPDTLRDSTLQADHIIISPEAFLTAAEDLANHRTNSGIKSVIASLTAIYDEFNVNDSLETWEAIHAFLKYTFEKWEKPATTFVLLLGDGPNPVPTYPKSGSTFTSDTRFVFIHGSLPEMAIGRFPVNTVTEAENVVEKTIEYESNPDMGLWRRRVTLVADDFLGPHDFNETTHTTNSEIVYSKIPKSLEVKKVYMEEFPPVYGGPRVSKPGATKALINILEEGTAIVNYIGHGSPYTWAHERLLSSEQGDLSLINTGMKLPIWMGATCNWGAYDQPEGNTFSEEILRLRSNGAIAIIASTENITYSANKEFIIHFFEKLFPSGTVATDRLGIIFQNTQSDPEGDTRFHLLGDPALKLPFPTNTVSIDNVVPEPLVALSEGNYAGHVGHEAPDQGNGFAVLYDSYQNTYSIFGKTDTIRFVLPGRPLFRGSISFSKSSSFQGGFIVPKDINYSTLNGRLAVYLYGEEGNELWEGLGVKEGLILVGGTTNPQDDEGPIISFMFQDRTLQWGDHVPETGELKIRFSDLLGINITGEVGHAIRLWIDEDETNATDLTHLFVYDAQNYKTGTISLSMDNLSPGETILTVEGWDNANNPSRTTIALNLTTSDDLQLKNVFNFPNPFLTTTQFGFEVTEESNVSIKIFTLAGQLIKTLEPLESLDCCYGYEHINWDGRDDFGDLIANGVYLYQIKAESVKTGKKVTKIQKLAKYR